MQSSHTCTLMIPHARSWKCLKTAPSVKIIWASSSGFHWCWRPWQSWFLQTFWDDICRVNGHWSLSIGSTATLLDLLFTASKSMWKECPKASKSVKQGLGSPSSGMNHQGKSHPNVDEVKTCENNGYIFFWRRKWGFAVSQLLAGSTVAPISTASSHLGWVELENLLLLPRARSGHVPESQREIYLSNGTLSCPITNYTGSNHIKSTVHTGSIRPT